MGDEGLGVEVEPAGGLPGGTAVDFHHRRRRLAVGPVRQRFDPVVARLVGGVLRGDEPVGVDVAVVGLDEPAATIRGSSPSAAAT